MKLALDPWQKEFIETKEDKILNCGRQVGKSEICGIDAGEYAIKHENENILMIAPTERQSYALFDKTLDYLAANYASKIAKGRLRPTKQRINLTNKTKIYCLPTGLSGLGIRFLTVHRLYVDECSQVPEEVFTAVTPMLLTTGGAQIYLSTPHGTDGMFYHTWINKDGHFDSFKRFSVDSETVVRERKICRTWTQAQRDKALTHLAREKARMTNSQYQQEYMGQFIDSLRQLFPAELIKSCMTVQRGKKVNLSGDNFLGVDVARMGGDDTVLFSVVRIGGKKLKQTDLIISNRSLLTETARLIKHVDNKYHYKKIYIDDGGLGAGVFDPLLEDNQTKRRVVAINNASRPLDRDEKQRKKILKQDLYSNLLWLMEKKAIALFDDPEIFQSLRSIQYEYCDAGKIKIFGNYSHIAEALVRAAWCMKDKTLKLWVAYR